MRSIFASVLPVVTAVALSIPTPSSAQEVTLRLHQFLAAQANVPLHILDVWADRVEADSDGRIRIERFASMQLGGTPPELYDQVVDGVADIVWTAVGYTPGRFPSTEVFELPFMVSDARAASYAFWSLYEEAMQDEFADVKMLGTWVHGPGIFHTKDPVTQPGDLRGMQIRGPSRLVVQMLETLGATSVGMPVPGVPEALSRGVIDGAMVPWEVAPSLRIEELVENHTEFEDHALYTLTFILAMNRDRYDALPEDLRDVIDRNSGLEFSVFAGGTQESYDAPARAVAEELGNNIITIPAAEVPVWTQAAAPVYDRWLADMAGRGIDGQALIDRARELMDAYKPE